MPQKHFDKLGSKDIDSQIMGSHNFDVESKWDLVLSRFIITEKKNTKTGKMQIHAPNV